MPLSDYQPLHPNLPDEFELDASSVDSRILFPCCACRHRERPSEECDGCCFPFKGQTTR